MEQSRNLQHKVQQADTLNNDAHQADVIQGKNPTIKTYLPKVKQKKRFNNRRNIVISLLGGLVIGYILITLLTKF